MFVRDIYICVTNIIMRVKKGLDYNKKEKARIRIWLRHNQLAIQIEFVSYFKRVTSKKSFLDKISV